MLFFYNIVENTLYEHICEFEICKILMSTEVIQKMVMQWWCHCFSLLLVSHVLRSCLAYAFFHFLPLL